MTQLRLEKCGMEQLDALTEISRVTFEDAFAHLNEPDDFKVYLDSAFSRENMEAELKNKDSSFYFVYDETELAGYFKLNKGRAQTDIKDEDSMEIERIYVLANFQGRKIGQWMMDRIKVIAGAEKLKYIWLGVWEENTAAIAFYIKHGFEKFGEHPYYIGKDRQMDWLMRFDITKLAL